MRWISAFICEFRSMHGLVEYFWRSVWNFSQTAHTLYQHLKKIHPNQKLGQDALDWIEIHQGTAEQHLQHPPTLADPNFRKPFILHTDASGLRLGCALFQLQDENLTVIDFGISTLVGAKMKLSRFKLAFMGLKWELCELLKDNLFYVTHFDVYTEYNPLTYIINMYKVNA